MSKEDFESKFKPGDVLRVESWIMIYARLCEVPIRNVGSEWSILHFAAICDTGYVVISPNLQTCVTHFLGYKEDDSIRKATNYEKEQLYHSLKIRGYRWDKETITLEKTANYY